MDPQYDHKLINSLYLWTEDRLARVGGAQVTGISQNFVYSDLGTDVPPNMLAYYSNDRQFLTIGDSDVVPSGVYINSVFTPQDLTGAVPLIIDNEKGRVLVHSSVGDAATISGNFSRKEMNVYVTESSEESLLLNEEFIVNGESFLESISGMGLERYTVPALFITPSRSQNIPFALGGEDDTKSIINAVVVSDDRFLLKGVMSLFNDTARLTFPLLDSYDVPYGEFYSIKEHPYSYTGYTADKGSGGCVFIEDVVTSTFKGGGDVSKALKGKYIGFIDFTLSKVRNPRIA
tara:strand:+ start:36734 stop:37603 length:870 start_codon:yes stop_codon:yes gene_type:complete